MAIRCKKRPAKKKCCIRSSKLRKCTLKNMCPRKRCKKTACDPMELEKLKNKYSRDLQSYRELIAKQQMVADNQALSNRYKKEAESYLEKIQKDSQKIQELNQRLSTSQQNISGLNMRLSESNQSAAGLSLEKMKLAEEKKILQEEKRKLAEEKERLLVEKKILNHALDGVSNENKNTIIKLGKQIEECRANLLTSVNELARLRSTGTASDSVLANLRKDIEKTNTEYKDLIKNYRSQMASCQSQLKNCKDSKLQIEELKSQLQSEVIRYKNDNQLQKTLLTESMETNKNLLSKYDTLTEERDKMKQALGNLAQSSMARTNRLKRELEESNKRNSESSDCSKKLEECHSRLGVCDREKDKLLADIQELKKEMTNNLAKQKWQGAAKGSMLQQEYQQLQQEYQAKVAEFQKYQAESISEIAKLKQELANYAKQIQNRIKQQALSKGKRTEMSQEIENMKRDYQMSENQLNERIKNLNEENASLNGKYTECTTQKSALELQIRQCKANTLTLTTAIAELKGSALALKKDLTDQKEYIERSKNTLKEQNAEIGNLTNRIGKLQNVNEDKAKLINDLEQSNARFNELQKEFNKVTLKVAELESSLATSLGNFAEKSNEANALIQKISTLSAELEQLKGTDAMNVDRIKSLESEISRLNGSLNRLKTDLGDKNSKMEQLINEIAGQTIGQLIASYQELASYYNKKNAELRSSVKRITPEEKQIIDDQIANNNQIIATIKEQLMVLLEQQDKFKKEKAALERLNRFNEEQVKLNLAKAELEKFKLSNKLIESNIERNKAQRAEALRREQEAQRAEQERQAQIRAQELAKIQQTIDELNNVKPMPLYLSEILKNYKEPSGIINGKDIYQNLSLYNDKLLKTGLTDVYQIVKNLMTYDVETFRADAVRAGKERLINEFLRSRPMTSTISTYSDNLSQLKQNVSMLINLYIELKDEIYPVRIIVNFGAILAKNTPINNKSIPENNYNAEKVSGDPRKINDIVNGGIYGPFYGVTNTSDNNYNVNEDVIRMFNPDESGKVPHLIYSAYGFSGSGKSYTLIAKANKNNILARLIKSINANIPPEEKANTYLRYSIYDNYGEINDGECNVITESVTKQEPVGEEYVKNSAYLVNKKINLDDYTEIENNINAFEKQRQQMLISPMGRSEFHIRFTPNNDESSRSHLFVDIDIVTGNEVRGRATIIDMAGSEDVNTIQNSYFESIPTNYTGIDMVHSLETISSSLNLLALQASESSGSFKEVDSRFLGVGKIMQPIQHLNIDIRPFRLIDQKGSFIKKDAWKALKENLGSLDIKLDQKDFNDFINDYNFYNYYSKIVYPIFKLKVKILEVFNNGTLKLTDTCNDVGNCVNFDKLNEIFKLVGLVPLTKTYLDISGLKLKFKYFDPSNAQQNRNFIVWSKLVNEKLEPQIDNIYNVLVSSNNGELMDLINRYNKELTPIQRAAISSMKLDIKDYKGSLERIEAQKNSTDKLIDKWNTTYLYKLHCPLRYQGRYIVKTLNQMVNYVSCLQNHKVLKSQFPGNILHNQLTFTQGTRGSLPNSQPKFVLFNNIRLDFSTNGQGVKSGAEQQNRNIQDAYTNSIIFADSVNPLTGKMKGCDQSLSFGKRKKKHTEGKLISDYKYILSL